MKKVWNICFIICHQHQRRTGKIKANKTKQISVKTEVFFVNTELQHVQKKVRSYIIKQI